MRLYYPAKPWRIAQEWGILNPIYNQFGYSRHNGTDFALGADKMLYSPIAGTIVRTGNQPKGGGIFLGLMTAKEEFADGKFHVLIDLLHCEKLLVQEGDKVAIGHPLAIADNTGFSTGPHTHMQIRRQSYWNNEVGDKLIRLDLDKNDANNSMDPTPHWTGHYAQDYDKMVSLTQALILLLQKWVGSLSK